MMNMRLTTVAVPNAWIVSASGDPHNILTHSAYDVWRQPFEHLYPPERSRIGGTHASHASPEYSKTLSFLSTSPFLLTACNREA
jgi:hypothetical protein